MAEEKKKEVAEERIYTINLRRELLETPLEQKARGAIRFIQKFLKKHMKSDDIFIADSLNYAVWERGIQKIPAKIRIKAKKDENGLVKAELFEVKEATEMK